MSSFVFSRSSIIKDFNKALVLWEEGVSIAMGWNVKHQKFEIWKSIEIANNLPRWFEVAEEMGWRVVIQDSGIGSFRNNGEWFMATACFYNTTGEINEDTKMCELMKICPFSLMMEHITIGHSFAFPLREDRDNFVRAVNNKTPFPFSMGDKISITHKTTASMFALTSTRGEVLRVLDEYWRNDPSFGKLEISNDLLDKVREGVRGCAPISVSKKAFSIEFQQGVGMGKGEYEVYENIGDKNWEKVCREKGIIKDKKEKPVSVPVSVPVQVTKIQEEEQGKALSILEAMLEREDKEKAKKKAKKAHQPKKEKANKICKCGKWDCPPRPADRTKEAFSGVWLNTEALRKKWDDDHAQFK